MDRESSDRVRAVTQELLGVEPDEGPQLQERALAIYDAHGWTAPQDGMEPVAGMLEANIKAALDGFAAAGGLMASAPGECSPAASSEEPNQALRQRLLETLPASMRETLDRMGAMADHAATGPGLIDAPTDATDAATAVRATVRIAASNSGVSCSP